MKFAELLFKKLNEDPEQIWIHTDKREITRKNTLQDIDNLKIILDKHNLYNQKIIGIAMKSSYEFVVADLFSLKNNVIALPIPLDFENEQIKHLLKNVNLVMVRTDSDAARLHSILPDKSIINISSGNLLFVGNDSLVDFIIPDDIIKIVHTSGTTSNPKGVMVRDKSMIILLDELLKKFPPNKLNYISLVPMSLLIEQVLAIYCTLLSGGKLTILPESLKEFGSQYTDSEDYLKFIKRYDSNFIYLAPKLLDELDKNFDKYNMLHGAYIITGGATVNHNTLRRLLSKGVNVYEGYGLSENTSVVSINSVTEQRIGTAGKVLPHLQYKVINGELLIKGETLCAGYLGKDDSSCEIDNDGYLYTGDLVEFDEDGYLIIKGRKKHIIILSNARNISPEWVESKLKRIREIYDCVIIGDGMDYLTAIIMSNNKFDADVIIEQVNQQLPDFAKIGKTIIVTKIEEFRKKYYTVTGRPKRSIIHRSFINDSKA